MPCTIIGKHVRVVDAEGLSIDELAGNVSTTTDTISIAKVSAAAAAMAEAATLDSGTLETGALNAEAPTTQAAARIVRYGIRLIGPDRRRQFTATRGVHGDVTLFCTYPAISRGAIVGPARESV